MLQECSTWRVLQVFFNEPNPQTLGHSLREISRRSGLAHTSTKKHLQTLEDKGLVKTREKKEGSREYPIYLPNRNSEKYKHYKTIDMINKIRKSGLLEKLEKEVAPDCIVLFGSAANGEDLMESDVDLYVQSEEKDLEISEYQNFLNRSIQLHFNPDFSSYPPELKNNISNGIVLQGYLKVF